MNEYNSFAFDGTIHRYPYQYTKNISFINKNISNINNDMHTNLHVLLERYNNIFVKMDIEGGEYPWLLSLKPEQLQNIKQILIEFHGTSDNKWGCKNEDKIKCLEKLSQTHYIVHAHGNNYAGVVNNIPLVIELTYVNKSCFDSPPELNTQPLPDPLIRIIYARKI